MQAIETKFIGPSYKLSSRIVAFCQAKRKVFSYNTLQDELIDKKINPDVDNCSKLAAEKLVMELGWNTDHYGRMVMGTLKNGNNVFVFTKE